MSNMDDELDKPRPCLGYTAATRLSGGVESCMGCEQPVKDHPIALRTMSPPETGAQTDDELDFIYKRDGFSIPIKAVFASLSPIDVEAIKAYIDKRLKVHHKNGKITGFTGTEAEAVLAYTESQVREARIDELEKINNARTIEGDDDLSPWCSNCHMMLESAEYECGCNNVTKDRLAQLREEQDNE